MDESVERDMVVVALGLLTATMLMLVLFYRVFHGPLLGGDPNPVFESAFMGILLLVPQTAAVIAGLIGGWALFTLRHEDDAEVREELRWNALYGLLTPLLLVFIAWVTGLPLRFW